MCRKKISLEKYKILYNQKFPNNDLKIIKFEGKLKVVISTNYGYCILHKKSLLKGATPSIITALNKTIYFINQLKEIYKNKYDYSYTQYINYNTKIKIYCKKHGYFLQRSDHLLNKIGCPKCGREITANFIRNNPIGWNYTNWIKAANRSKNFDSFKVYIIKCWNDNEEFYKIGKTFCKIKKRFDWKHLMPYKYKILKIFEDSGEKISMLEQELKKLNKMNKYIPKINFPGKEECFKKIEKYEIISS